MTVPIGTMLFNIDYGYYFLREMGKKRRWYYGYGYNLLGGYSWDKEYHFKKEMFYLNPSLSSIITARGGMGIFLNAGPITNLNSFSLDWTVRIGLLVGSMF